MEAIKRWKEERRWSSFAI